MGTKMTKDEILAMPAGPKMDALIERDVIKTRFHKKGEVIPFGQGIMRPGGVELLVDCFLSPTGRVILPKPYSTDIAAAWQVFEELKKLGCPEDEYADLTIRVTTDGYWVGWTWHETEYDPSAEAPTAPLAICCAALMTLTT